MKNDVRGSLRSISIFSSFFLLILLQANRLQAQCSSFISTFPYNENFETSPAWTSGGTNSDWAWGTPAHPTINSAGTGSKSWCVGGLNGSFYEYSAQSWLMSPCFNFSGLNNPWISFKIFWETEWQWDGIVLQYSLNGGITWLNLGAYGDDEDCLNENWFNYNNISWLGLTVKHGWTGRQGGTSGSCSGGNGSNGWVVAKHCMQQLAGKPSVRFRFLFGSGSSCNDFDGVAIDDILISEAASTSTPDFSYTCAGGGAIHFNNLSTGCIGAYEWNFGDPASGATNTSTLTDPTHTFAPGNYTVTLTSFGPCGTPESVTKTVSLIVANVDGTNVSCSGGNDGTATVNITSGTGPFAYAWTTIPVATTPTVTGLAAGDYTVTVSSPGSCPGSASITIEEPGPVVTSATVFPSCGDVCNGTVTATATGGTAPYTFNWETLGTGGTINDVCTGSYNVATTDANGCTGNTVTVQVETLPAPVIECNSPVICTGSGTHLMATGADSYTWTPVTGLSSGTGPVVFASPMVTTAYILTGTSAAGCSSSIDVLVTVDPTVAPVADFDFSPQTADVFTPLVEFINTSSGENVYTWDFAGLSASDEVNPVYLFPNDSMATYKVCLTAVNAVGCTDSICREIKVDGLAGVYIPNAFTPDGDGINDLFYPVVRDLEPHDFEWTVYDRWGGLIYSAKNQNAVWDGSRNGTLCKTDVYVWKIRYIEKTTGINKELVGQVSLIR